MNFDHEQQTISPKKYWQVPALKKKATLVSQLSCVTANISDTSLSQCDIPCGTQTCRTDTVGII